VGASFGVNPDPSNSTLRANSVGTPKFNEEKKTGEANTAPFEGSFYIPNPFGLGKKKSPRFLEGFSLLFHTQLYFITPFFRKLRATFTLSRGAF
jgi:hypothetical protein